MLDQLFAHANRRRQCFQWGSRGECYQIQTTVPELCFMRSFGLFPCLSSVLVEYVKAADVKVIAALGDSLTVSDEVVGFVSTEKSRNRFVGLWVH